MEWFYFITIVIAIILLIGALTFIGMRMSSAKVEVGDNSTVFPPIKNSCPDLWESEKDGNRTWCKIPNEGTANRGTLETDNLSNILGYSERNGEHWVNFNHADWETDGVGTSDCIKKDWAGMNGVSWDGITNYNQCG